MEKKIKLVASDMDDTLLTKDLTISTINKQTIANVLERDIHFTVATGRMYISALPYVRELNLKIPFISYNGAWIRDSYSDKIYYEENLPAEISHELLNMCRENNWYVQNYENDILRIEKANAFSASYLDVARVPLVEEGADFFKKKSPSQKILIMTDKAEWAAVSQKIKQRFGDDICVSSSKVQFVECTAPKANKGLALKFLAEHLGIKAQNVMAIGDAYNDVEMIKYAGVGVAVANAPQEVRAWADFVSLSHSENGVAHAIEKFVL